MQQSVQFSVITPTYNRPEGLKRAIESVLNQTYTSFEIIVIDDASTVDISDIIQTYETKCALHYRRNAQNSGPSYSRNQGLKMAKGNYVCFLDDDDSWLPHHLASLNKLIHEYPEGILFHSGAYRINAEKPEHKTPFLPKKIIRPNHYFFENPCITSSVCLVKKKINSLSFKEDLRYPEDYLFWLQVGNLQPFYCTNNITVQYFVSKTGALTNQKAAFIESQRISTIPYINSDNSIPPTYKKIYTSGIYFKICREQLNQSTELNRAFKALIKSIDLYPQIVLKPVFWRVLARFIKKVAMNYLYGSWLLKKDACTINSL